MKTGTQTPTALAPDRVSDRPPIFSALYVLGLRDAELARLLGVSTVAVHLWASAKKPMPVVRALALQYLVARLTGVIGAKLPPPHTRYARRSQVAIDAAARWCQLARDELEEDTGGVYRAEDIERGAALGQRMLARLEAQ